MRERAYRTEKQMLNRIEELEGVSCRALSRVRGLEAEVERLKLRVEKLDSRSEHRRRLNNNLEQDNADLTKRIEELEAAMTNGNLMVMKCDECKKLQVVTIKWGQRNRRCPVCL